jgi:cytochrome b561
MIGDSATAWGSVSRYLHWVAAVFVVALVAHGWWMTEFAPRDARIAHYAWHASVGYALLALMFARLFWRLGNAVPALPAIPTWERAVTSVGHWTLYALIFAAVFTGWALSGTLRRPLDSMFGLLRIPPIVESQDRGLHESLESWHAIVAWTLAALIVAHVVAAVWHLVVRKDGVMQRMLRSAPQP